MATFAGTGGHDTLTGTIDADLFKLFQGGDDTAFGGGGNDVFRMEGTLTAKDSLNGEAGNDKVILEGDYSGGVSFEAATITSVKVLRFGGDFSYNITTHDGNVAAGELLSIKGAKLGAGHSIFFNGSAELDGAFSIRASKGNDALFGGALGDQFLLSKGGDERVFGGAGDDTFFMGGAFTASDGILGDAGNDTLVLNGDYSAGLSISAGMMIDVETVRLGAGHDYNLACDDGSLGLFAEFNFDGSALGAGDTFVFNGAAENDSFLFVTGGAANDTLTGGNNNDVLKGGLGSDTIAGGATSDIIHYTSATESTGAGYDVIVGFEAEIDFFAVHTGGVNTMHEHELPATLNTATFEQDLADVMEDFFPFSPFDALVLDVTGGDLAGRKFLVVDGDGLDGYATGGDYVFDLTGFSGTFDETNFIAI